MNGMKTKKALITGTSGGIGRAAAIELSRRGASVALHGFTNREGTEQTAALVRAEATGDTEATVLIGDLSDAQVARKLVQEAEHKLGGLDILVNNAGDLIQRAPLAEITPELLTRVMGANVYSALFCSQAAARSMISRQVPGCIVNMGSLAAWNGGGPGSAPYAAAKGAVVSLTKALAKELAPHGIRVNCVSPGLIGNTAFHARFTAPEAFEALTKAIPLGRPGEPYDVARAIAFLASDDSAFLTGETIEINGGMYMR